MRSTCLPALILLSAASCGTGFLGAGAAVSARTDSGGGEGWVVSYGKFDESDRDWMLGPNLVHFEVSHLSYDDDVGHPQHSRLACEMGARWDRGRMGLGMALSWGDGDIWAIGPRLSAAVGRFGRRSELYVGAGLYVWLGERDDEFDVDVEADARLAASVVF